MNEKKTWLPGALRKDTLLYSSVRQDDSFDPEASSVGMSEEGGPAIPDRRMLLINIYHAAFFLMAWTLLASAVTWATVYGASAGSRDHHHEHHSLMKSPVPTRRSDPPIQTVNADGDSPQRSASF